MSQSTISSAKVPMGQKIAFGFGMLANQMFPAVLGIFMVVLVQDLGFPGWMWGIIYFFPRIFDSFTDPIMGFISDNTKSKWGRRRQYVLAGAIIMGIAFIMMWQLYRDNGVNYNFTYFMLWSFAFYLGLTIFSVPYVAMGYEMTDDFHERTNIMAIAQWIGQWAWVIAPWFWVIMYDNGADGWFESAEVATRSLAIWVGAILMIIAAIPAIFIKSTSTLDEDYSELNFSNIKSSFDEIILGFKQALRIKPFRKLCISTFLIFNAFNTVATFTFFVVVYRLFNGDTQAAGIWPTLFGSLGALSTTFIVIPIVAWISKKIGKKNAFLLSQGISIIGYAMLWFLFVPGKPYLFIFALPFFSFGIGSLFTLMMSMTSDVIDLDELNTGKRREGIFGAIYWWMVKFGFAIAGGLSGVIISFVGFQEGVPGDQQESAINGLRAFFSGLPILGTLVAMWVMKDYSVDEARALEIRKELDDRKEGISSSSNYTLHPSIAALIAGTAVPAVPNISYSSNQDLYDAIQDKLRDTIHGLCFSPFLEGQSNVDNISSEQIIRRMDIISTRAKWIRSFATTKGHEMIPYYAKERNNKTMAGAWISNDLERNDREINELIRLGKEGLVDIAAVGNEVLLRGELSIDQLIAYIKQVKAALPDVPVGYVDAYFKYLEHPELLEICDVILINCYPFWEGNDAAAAPTQLSKMYHVVKNKAPNKQVIIAETGWPTAGETIGNATPSLDTSGNYFVNCLSWAEAESIPIFYFSSFDESWKIRSEGRVGAYWGLWNSKEEFKYK